MMKLIKEDTYSSTFLVYEFQDMIKGYGYLSLTGLPKDLDVSDNFWMPKIIRYCQDRGKVYLKHQFHRGEFTPNGKLYECGNLNYIPMGTEEILLKIWMQ